MPSTVINPVRENTQIRAHGGPIEDVRSLTPFTIDTPIDVLKRHFEKDGVLWVCLRLPTFKPDINIS